MISFWKFALTTTASLMFLSAVSLWAAPPIKIEPGKSCVSAECHPGMGQEKFTHGPMNMKQCDPCHVPVNGEHNFSKDLKGRALCSTCHEIDSSKKVQHKPFTTDCTLCHNPHGADNRYFMKAGGGSAACLVCHPDVTKGLNFAHGPVAQGDCLACHTPHQSDYPKLLTDPPDKLCVTCHVDILERMKNAVSVHPPAKGNCTGCHLAHGGSTKYFVRIEGPKLCLQCHQPFLDKTAKVKYPHEAMTQGQGCANCHGMHATDQQKLLKQPDMGLCLGCHDKQIVAKDRTIPNIAAQINGAKYLHGPIRQKNCIGCHGAHGTEFPYILNKPFPRGFYSSYTPTAYSLCFDCHDKKIVMKERSTDTAFRNGDENLHYLHVNRDKGRSCHACHDEHASNQPKHIRETVTFGHWNMRTRFNQNTHRRGLLDRMPQRISL